MTKFIRVTFNYGQRHLDEVEIACGLAIQLGAHVRKVIDASLINELSVSSLTCDNIPVQSCEKTTSSLLSTFVPGRNILFLTLAAIYAYQVEATAVITGVCETDFSGYHDCRNEFIKAFNTAINLGMTRDLNFITPLMWLNKAETWEVADYYHQLDLVRHDTLTCYDEKMAADSAQLVICAPAA